MTRGQTLQRDGILGDKAISLHTPIPTLSQSVKICPNLHERGGDRGGGPDQHS